MTDYNDGNWHGWNGGECPVHPESEVDIVHEEGWRSSGKAHHILWYSSDPIVKPAAFRVTKPYVEPKKPRGWWILHGKIYGYNCDPSTIHVREVLE